MQFNQRTSSAKHDDCGDLAERSVENKYCEPLVVERDARTSQPPYGQVAFSPVAAGFTFPRTTCLAAASSKRVFFGFWNVCDLLDS